MQQIYKHSLKVLTLCLDNRLPGRTLNLSPQKHTTAIMRWTVGMFQQTDCLEKLEIGPSPLLIYLTVWTASKAQQTICWKPRAEMDHNPTSPDDSAGMVFSRARFLLRFSIEINRLSRSITIIKKNEGCTLWTSQGIHKNWSLVPKG